MDEKQRSILLTEDGCEAAEDVLQARAVLLCRIHPPSRTETRSVLVLHLTWGHICADFIFAHGIMRSTCMSNRFLLEC